MLFTLLGGLFKRLFQRVHFFGRAGRCAFNNVGIAGPSA